MQAKKIVNQFSEDALRNVDSLNDEQREYLLDALFDMSVRAKVANDPTSTRRFILHDFELQKRLLEAI